MPDAKLSPDAIQWNERATVPTWNSIIALAGCRGSGSNTLGRMDPPGLRERPDFFKMRAMLDFPEAFSPYTTVNPSGAKVTGPDARALT